MREVKEEVGITLSPNDGKIVFSKVRDFVNGKKFNDILDVWLFEYDGDINLNNATTDEVEQAIWLYPNEIKKLYEEQKLVHTLDYFFEKIDLS